MRLLGAWVIIAIFFRGGEAYLDPGKLIASYFTPEAFAKANATNGRSVAEDQSGNNHNIDVAPSNMIINNDYVSFNHNGGVAVNSLRNYEWGDEIGIIFWFRRAPPGFGGDQGIIGNTDENNRGSFGCFISGEDDSYHKKATFGVEIDVIDYDEDGKRIPETFDGLDIEVDVWHLVVFTKSESILNFYIDSRKVTFNGKFDWPAAGEIYPKENPLQIGGKIHQEEPFIGDLRDVYIYKQFIGRDDVCAIYGCETLYPTPNPTPYPPQKPTPEPSVYVEPTPVPTYAPSAAPTDKPTPVPTPAPTHPEGHPTPGPTTAPTNAPHPPTLAPTAIPTRPPTQMPTETPEPSPMPTHAPGVPTPEPTTAFPSPAPTAVPTTGFNHPPTRKPTPSPTPVPTPDPTFAPTAKPTIRTASGGSGGNDGSKAQDGGLGLDGEIGLGLGLSIFILGCCAIGWVYRHNVGKRLGLASYSEDANAAPSNSAAAIEDPQTAAGIKSRGKRDDEDSDEEPDSTPDDAYERWMKVVEENRDIRGQYVGADTANPLHNLENGEGGTLGEDLVIGDSDGSIKKRISSTDGGALRDSASIYDGYIVNDTVRRLSQELGRSESAIEDVVREKRVSSIGGSTIKRPSYTSSSGSALPEAKDRETALLRSAMASQTAATGGGRRPSVLTTPNKGVVGGRGARRNSLLDRGMARRPTQKYTPPTAAQRTSAVAEDAPMPTGLSSGSVVQSSPVDRGNDDAL